MSDSRKKSTKNRLDRIEVEACSEDVIADCSKRIKSSDSRKSIANTVWNGGPEELCPANSYLSVNLTDAVKIRMTNNDYTDYKPISIYSVFRNTVQENGNHPALAYKVGSHWIKISYSEYWKTCNKAAKSFIKMKLDIGASVGIIGFNSPQWFISFLGSIFAGGIGCGIYTTNTVEACEFIFKDSNTQIVVVENKLQLDKVIALKSKFKFKSIIQYTEEIVDNHDGLVISWEQFIELGSSVPDNELMSRIKTIAPNKCASLIYTSGTTGTPKAAMISHDNATYLSKYTILEILKFKKFGERLVSYLPLSHIAAQCTDLFAPLCTGITIYFAQPDALKSSLVETLKEAQPTMFFGVPRVYEKMQEKLVSIINSTTGVKLSLFQWARRVATQQVNLMFKGQIANSFEFRLAKTLVLNKIKSSLGLSSCKQVYCGAAPIRRDTLDFFVSLGIPLCEVFGMSESSSAHVFGLANQNRIGSVGRITRLNKSKIANPDESGCGELCISSRAIFMGYLNNLEKSKECFDEDGWLRTGDLAKIDREGFLYITGRIKEIVITAGGENIAPIPIEDAIKVELPYLVSNCMVVGDKKKYLTVLVTLKSKINLDTLEPYDELTDECKNFLKTKGSNSTKVSQCIRNQDPIVYKLIDAGIKKANEKSVSRAAKIQKFEILHRDFSLFYGDLGPTMKLRRPIVSKTFEKEIENFYKDDAGND